MIHCITLYTLETYQLDSGSWFWHIYNILMGTVMAERSMLLFTWMLVICAWYIYIYIYVCMNVAMYMPCGYRKEFNLDLRDPKVRGKSHHENYYLDTTWTQAAYRKQCFFVGIRFILIWFCMIISHRDWDMLNYAIGKSLSLSENSCMMVQIFVLFICILVIHQATFSAYVETPSHIMYTIQSSSSYMGHICV